MLAFLWPEDRSRRRTFSTFREKFKWQGQYLFIDLFSKQRNIRKYNKKTNNRHNKTQTIPKIYPLCSLVVAFYHVSLRTFGAYCASNDLLHMRKKKIPKESQVIIKQLYLIMMKGGKKLSLVLTSSYPEKHLSWDAACVRRWGCTWLGGCIHYRTDDAGVSMALNPPNKWINMCCASAGYMFVCKARSSSSVVNAHHETDV